VKGLYVINSLEGGGAERVFSVLASLVESDSKGDEIEVVLLDIKNEIYQLPQGIKIHRIGKTNPLLSFFKFLKIVRTIKPDYVLSFLTRANNFNVFGSFLSNYKSIISERSNTSTRLQGRLKNIKRQLVKILYNKANCIISVSEGVKHCLVEDFSIDENKIKILNNAIDIEKVTAMANVENRLHPKPYIIAMGRLVKTKGFNYLIKAYAKASTKSDLLILGDGPEMENLTLLAKKLQVENKIHFMGFQSNPYTYIKQSEFFVLSSELEGFPNALVEALGLGKAVLSTNCTDGPSEILNLTQSIEPNEVIKSKYGVLVNIRDVRALEKGLLILERDIALRRKYESSSIKCAEQYSPESFYNNFKLILNDNI
jgi:N-acetylgalactosamine-N,N'-diacetylbacillosaminyl-diphospho-undecaprenol 4-alpha-N-acetylgalactosaminyltransferase